MALLMILNPIFSYRYYLVINPIFFIFNNLIIIMISKRLFFRIFLILITDSLNIQVIGKYDSLFFMSIPECF